VKDLFGDCQADVGDHFDVQVALGVLPHTADGDEVVARHQETVRDREDEIAVGGTARVIPDSAGDLGPVDVDLDPVVDLDRDPDVAGAGRKRHVLPQDDVPRSRPLHVDVRRVVERTGRARGIVQRAERRGAGAVARLGGGGVLPRARGDGGLVRFCELVLVSPAQVGNDHLVLLGKERRGQQQRDRKNGGKRFHCIFLVDCEPGFSDRPCRTPGP
jgi:hypothetical protein